MLHVVLYGILKNKKVLEKKFKESICACRVKGYSESKYLMLNVSRRYVWYFQIQNVIGKENEGIHKCLWSERLIHIELYVMLKYKKIFEKKVKEFI